MHAFTLVEVFPSHTVLIVTLASTFFDGSALMFPVLKCVFDAGISLHTIGISLIFLNMVLVSAMICIRRSIERDMADDDMPEEGIKEGIGEEEGLVQPSS